MYSISFSADQRYITPNSGGVPTYENAKQVQALPMRLVDLYAFNSSAAVLYLAVYDSKDAATTIGVGGIVVYPIPAGGFVSVSQHGGMRLSSGLYVKAFTGTSLAVAAGNVLLYKIHWIDAV